MSASWNKQKKWTAVVEPGFLNGRCPKFRTTEVADGETKQVDTPLYMRPLIPMRWRPLGWDSETGGAVPQFFKDRGASDAQPEITAAAIDEGASVFDTPEAPKTLRLLRACDIWLHQPRIALTSQIEITPAEGLLTGRSLVSQTLSVTSPVAGDTLQVLAGELRRLERGIAPLQNLYAEESFDDVLIATVFALSPRSTPAGSEPDGSWQCFVRHNLFWNLNHVVPFFRQVREIPQVIIFPPLAGGAASFILNYFVASTNDAFAEAFTRISANTLQGTFYTPTGGGHSAEKPPVTERSPARTGLNKTARNRAATAARGRARRTQALDPDFPYRAEPFDPKKILQTPL